MAIYDKAALIGTASQPLGTPPFNTEGKAGAPAGGTITFKLYGPDTGQTGCPGLAEGFPAAGIQVTVEGDNTEYGANGILRAEFEPKHPGTYHWVAEYSGDAPNTKEATHNTDCSDSKESVTVEQIPTEIETKQSWYPQDTINVKSGKGNLAEGQLEIKLFEGKSCSGEAKFEEKRTLAGGQEEEEVTTNNKTFAVDEKIPYPATKKPEETETFSWLVTYTPSDKPH